MIQKPENSQIAESTISKVAEVVFSSQIDNAESLDIRVKVDTDRIISGQVDEIYVDSTDLSVSPNISMTSLDIQLNEVQVNPWKAVLGNAELSQPTSGYTEIILGEGDIARVLSSQKILEELRDRREIAGTSTQELEIADLSCQLSEKGQLTVTGKGVRSQAGDSIPISFETSLKFDAGRIILKELNLDTTDELSEQLTRFAVEKTEAFLNLQYFTLEGVMVTVERLEFMAGQMKFCARVDVEQIPE